MQDKLCCPCSPRNPLITRLQLMCSHVSVICERSSNFWVIAFVFDRLHTAVAVKPNKNVNTSDIFCVLYQNYQARLNRLNLTAYKFLGTGNRDIIDIAISFLSDIHLRNICYWINQYPYQYLVFIVISFSVLARQWICLWSYHHFYISVDVFEAWWIKKSILPHLNFAVLATRYYDLILTLCGSINTKRKNWWISSPHRRVILSEWYQYDNFSRVNEGPNSQSTLQDV